MRSTTTGGRRCSSIWTAAPPPFFSRFERLAEIVSLDEADIASGRERWKFYKARGYEIRSFNLSARS